MLSMLAAFHTPTDLANWKQTHDSADRPAIKQAHFFIFMLAGLEKKLDQISNFTHFPLKQSMQYLYLFQTNK